MPFARKITVETGVLGIWKIAEPASELQIIFNFSDSEKREFEKITSQKRQIEYLAIRLLLFQLFNSKIEIGYHSSGRPFLVNNPLNISISHSADLVVVFISEKHCGADVEVINRNIDRVAQRFLHKLEWKEIEKLPNGQLAKILSWCAKEAIFKCSFAAEIDFQSQIFLFPFVPGHQQSFKGTLINRNKTEHFRLWYFWFENNMIVYCVEL